MVDMDNKLTVAEAAWMAGLYDGEGSVGVRFQDPVKRNACVIQIQLNMTHEPTVALACDYFKRWGSERRYYTQQKRQQAHHKTAYMLNVGRTGVVWAAARELTPYAVTKRTQWELVLELCELRASRLGIIPDKGWLKRGGAPGWQGEMPPRELELMDELIRINHRPKKGDTVA